jgi:hypothetical protein
MPIYRPVNTYEADNLFSMQINCKVLGEQHGIFNLDLMMEKNCGLQFSYSWS